MHGHASPRERQRDAAGADAELERGAAARQLGEEVDDRVDDLGLEQLGVRSVVPLRRHARRNDPRARPHSDSERPDRQNGAMELRLVLTVADLDAALALYRDALGLEELEAWHGEGEGARIAILDAGRATLELVNEAQAAAIDRIEVGERTAGPSGSRSRSTTANASPAGSSTRGGAARGSGHHAVERPQRQAPRRGRHAVDALQPGRLNRNGRNRGRAGELCRVPEQSHLDEMREKIRGDRERAARRGHTVFTPPVPRAEPAPPPPERDGLRSRVRRALLGG